MNWQVLASLGEFLGGVGVIITLIYLSLQIRQNTRAARAATAQQTTDNWVAINLQMMAQRDMFADGSLSDLPREEFQAILGFWRAIFHQWASTHYQFSIGALDDVLFTPTGREIGVYASDPTMGRNLRLAWESTRFIYNDDFAAYMDELLENNPVPA